MSNPGPTRIKPRATSSRPPVRKVNTTARKRVFQNDRSSPTSYAISMASIIAENALDAAQRNAAIPNDRIVPLWGVTTAANSRRIEFTAPSGRKRPTQAQARTRTEAGEYVARVNSEISAQETDMTK